MLANDPVKGMINPASGKKTLNNHYPKQRHRERREKNLFVTASPRNKHHIGFDYR